MTDFLSVPGNLGLAVVLVGCDPFFARVHVRFHNSLSAQRSISATFLFVVHQSVVYKSCPLRYQAAKSMGSLFQFFRSFAMIIPELSTAFLAPDTVALCVHPRVASMSGSLKTCTVLPGDMY